MTINESAGSLRIRRPLCVALVKTRWLTLLPGVAALLMAAASPAEVTLSTGFEGGSLGECRSVAEDHLECAVQGQVDQDGRNRQASWYYFRVDGAAGRPVTVDLTELAGEYNYEPNKGAISDATPPWVSADGKQWTPLSTIEYRADPPRLTLRLPPGDRPLWVAHVPPYTTADLDRLLSEIGDHPFLSREVIGKTAEGRDLLLLTITDPSVPDDRKIAVWLMFRQHAWEAGTSWVAEGGLRDLLRGGRAAQFRRLVFKIFPMCDPDGVAAGRVRFNKHGYDLNRNWDHIIVEKMPEIAAQRKAVFDWLERGRKVDFFLTVHNTETAEYIEGPPKAPAMVVELMSRFNHVLQQSTSFAPTRRPSLASESTTPGRPGRMTVNQYLGSEKNLPAFLMELAIGRSLKLGRHPTVEDRKQFGGELVEAIMRSVRRPTSRGSVALSGPFYAGE